MNLSRDIPIIGTLDERGFVVARKLGKLGIGMKAQGLPYVHDGRMIEFWSFFGFYSYIYLRIYFGKSRVVVRVAELFKKVYANRYGSPCYCDRCFRAAKKRYAREPAE